MQFTDPQINQLKSIRRQDGGELTQREALDLAHCLVARVQSIAHPIPQDDREEFERIAHSMRSTNR